MYRIRIAKLIKFRLDKSTIKQGEEVELRCILADSSIPYENKFPP